MDIKKLQDNQPRGYNFASSSLLALAGKCRCSECTASRVKNLTFTEMKAIIDHSNIDISARKMEVYVRYYNENTDAFDGALQEIDIPFTSFTDLKSLNQVIENNILTEASNRSYGGFVADSVIWHTNNQVHKIDAGTLTGIVSDVIDGKVQGNTTVYTNNSNKNLLITGVWINPTDVAGLGTPPTINIGKTANTYSDMVNTLSLSLAVTPNTYSQSQTKNNANFLANGETLTVRVAIASVLTTTYSFRVIITGIYV